MAFVVWIVASVFVAAGAQKCAMEQIMTCSEPLSTGTLDFSNLEAICKTLAGVKHCLEVLKARCPALGANIDSGLAGVVQQHNSYCSTSGCSPVKQMKCTSMMDKLNVQGAPTKETCELMSQPIKCFEEVFSTCPAGKEKDMQIQSLLILKQQHQMCVTMTSGGDGNGGQLCGPAGLNKCHMLMDASKPPSNPASGPGSNPASGPGSNPSNSLALCKILDESKTCYEQLYAVCSDSPFKDNVNTTMKIINEQWANLCDASPTSCSVISMLNCTGMMQAEMKDENPTVVKCETLLPAVQCIQTMRPTCQPPMVITIDQMLASIESQYQICVQQGNEENDQSPVTVASPLGSKPQTTKPMGNKPIKSGPGGKKPTSKGDSDDKDMRQSTTKKPKGDKDHGDAKDKHSHRTTKKPTHSFKHGDDPKGKKSPSEDVEDEDDEEDEQSSENEVQSEGKEVKQGDNKKSLTTDHNGASMAAASFLATVIAVGILVIVPRQI